MIVSHCIGRDIGNVLFLICHVQTSCGKNVLLIYFTIPVPFLLIPFSLFVPVPSLHSQRTLQNRFWRLGVVPHRDRLRCSRRPFESAGTWAACFAALCTAALSSERKRVCAHAACPCAGIAQDAKNRPKMAFCLHPRKNYVKYYFPH